MQRTRAFFYVCAGLFLLALSWHFGAMSAGAQSAGGAVASAFAGNLPGHSFTSVAVTSSGDVYGLDDSGWSYHSNVFAGGPVPAQRESFGSVKARYR